MSTLASWPGLRRRALLLAALLLPAAGGMANALPTFAEVQRASRPSEAMLHDRHGEEIHQLRLNLQERRLPWVRLDDVSPALRTALILSEDQRFYRHSGVDWNAVAAAAWSNLWNTRTRGASTLTMQLAGLLDEDLRRRAAPRSITQKLTQAVVAQQLEHSWRKDQILEAYLNLVGFRGELVGVHALSRVLFHKHPSGLNRREAAIAVALLRAPNAHPAKVAERACTILKEQQAAAECNGIAGITELTLARLSSRADLGGSIPSPQLAPHLAQRLLKAPNQPVRSTIDAATQRFARDAVRRQLAALVERNIEDSAVLVLDNASGDVLAWVGSSGDFSDARHVDGVLALRQAGSTLKPFLYQLALEQKWLTAASLLDDAPLNLTTAAGLYIPQNYDRRYQGLVSLRTALGSSLNIPAVRVLVTVTPERLFQRLQALGFGLRESGDYYGYSLALGSADVSLLALTNAYRALANQGRASPVRTSLGDAVVKPRQVMDPAAAFIISDILADRSARAVTFGLENALAGRVPAAVKTGTSKDMRDNWCIGYSERYTVGVWVGNASGA
ncbi:MAG TPA: penicillin-binding protein 1C, partial [Burkholderiaceae bacterium]|nr:penicillin-binding protein 1C [Burkholderiaceae bacterium]